MKPPTLSHLPVRPPTLSHLPVKPPTHLVPEGLPHLRCREGQLAAVEVEQVLEVHKDALRGLGPKEAGEAGQGGQIRGGWGEGGVGGGWNGTRGPCEWHTKESLARMTNA